MSQISENNLGGAVSRREGLEREREKHGGETLIIRITLM